MGLIKCNRNAKPRIELPSVLLESARRSISKTSRQRSMLSAKLKNRTSTRTVSSVRRSSVSRPNSASTRRECHIPAEALLLTHPLLPPVEFQGVTATLRPISSSTSPSLVLFPVTNCSETTSNQAVKRLSVHLPDNMPVYQDRTAWPGTQVLELT